ncbi:C-_U-editing enzyme APOBEC-1 isoform X2 [Heterocephalus glaber]|uniref:C->U-editing enzyme APOBEC-1 n=1 Tax=Heterocephalus glaber TaxID=10181 RepID=A0AAX6Q7M2_HETGA|nr:C->U-editing enzyme APOBEC-1 isoform X2 [Heterocephalus glaber]
MTSGQGPSAGDPTLRRRIEPWQFEASFDPRQLRRETCLLSEVQWGTSPRAWRGCSLNTARHAEVSFMDRLTSEGRLRGPVRCSITWFLSWSPCGACAQAIGEFLRQHPNVSLVIYIARLFWHVDEQNRQGLRDLVTRGVRMQVMSDPEFAHCWRNFVNYSPGQEARWPQVPPVWTWLYSLELHCILLNLPPCLKISRRHHNQLTFFQLILQNCHYQAIPSPVLLASGLIHPFVTWA